MIATVAVVSWIADHTAAWERQYTDGRYLGEAPDPFVVEDVLGAARAAGIRDGLDVGCGNGRNLLPLLDAGLPLVGVDVSATAIEQLRGARPEHAGRVRVGALDSLVSDEQFDLVMGIQVFMFGDRRQAHEHIGAAQRRVRPGGLLALRANAVGTDVWPAHDVAEEHPDGSFSVTYSAGPKAGLQVHFFSAAELERLFEGWEPVLALRRDRRERANGQGQWTQFEGIWRRPGRRQPS